ncbi:hypothetical protein MKW94_000227 [Papaver nudicaule]|uniref:YDG domain-containing protein n=1 Tax=Papaver nudicaule TaxID=74823 RepID=A0AA41RNW4_PAPNU|nr:hypothetical protein [Papaver nudicaule]
MTYIILVKVEIIPRVIVDKLVPKRCSNNIGQDVPVRVIRGHQSKSSDGKPGRTYTYDGLYKVIGSWPEKGASGFTVYKFHLKRIQGQTPLTTKQVWYLICIKKKRVC